MGNDRHTHAHANEPEMSVYSIEEQYGLTNVNEIELWNLENVYETE